MRVENPDKHQIQIVRSHQIDNLVIVLGIKIGRPVVIGKVHSGYGDMALFQDGAGKHPCRRADIFRPHSWPGRPFSR